jgi:hypothetical protein
MTCCAYSCTQQVLHTQYMLLTHADDFLYLQQHTQYMLLTHADDLLCVKLQRLCGSNSTYCPGRTDSKFIAPFNAFTTIRATRPATCEESISVQCTELGIEGLQMHRALLWFFPLFRLFTWLCMHSVGHMPLWWESSVIMMPTLGQT